MAQSILSLNCRGLGDKLKREDIFLKLKEQKIHISCLQDIHICQTKENLVKSEWGLDIVMAPFKSNSRGVAILFNNNYEHTIHKIKIDPNGNYILVDLTIQNSLRFTLVNLYGPNEDEPIFYENLKRYIEEFENETFLICGDWNLILEPQKDMFNYKHINNPKARETVTKFIEEKNLVDVWRIFNENEKQYTWHKKHPIKMARLDFFLATEDLLSVITDAEILPKYKSDHSPVLIRLLNKQNTHGRGYWKFNNSLLKDTDFVQMVKKVIKETKEQYAATPYTLDYIEKCPNSEIQLVVNEQLFWETLLMKIRGECIQYASRKKKKIQHWKKN